VPASSSVTPKDTCNSPVAAATTHVEGQYHSSPLKNLRTGDVLNRVFPAGHEIMQADVERRRATFLYREGDEFVFMDEDYEEIRVPEEVVGGAKGFGGFPKLTTLFWTLVWAWLTVVLLKNLVNSVHGRALLAIREDEVAAEAVGINTTFYKTTAFVLGAFFAGVAGCLFAHFLLYINPASFDFLKSVELVVMVVLGGMGSLTGSVVAATVLTVLREWLRVAGAYRLVLYAALLVVMMLIRPTGLLGGWELSWTWVRQQLSRWRRLTAAGEADHGAA